MTERILLVGSDPEIWDVLARQALAPLGYQIKNAPDAGTALHEAAIFAPDLVIADLNLPGLSGKDLLVAFNAQGSPPPVIVIARRGEEQKVIQSFRLGACDYLLWPVNETEVVAAVERALKQVRDRRSRERLDRQLKETNLELGQRVRELTTIFAVGKAVISITDQRVLFDQLVEGMVAVAQADYGWLILRQDHNRTFILAAHRNLPEAWAKKMGQTLDDGLSSLVALSGETLAINGEPVKRFQVATLGQSAMAVPVKIHKEVIGLLMLVRKADKPFDRSMQSLLEAISDYASISLVNSRLFRALQERAEIAQSGERTRQEQLMMLRQQVQTLLTPVTYPVDLLLAGKIGKLTPAQSQALITVRDAVKRALALSASEPPEKPAQRE